MAIMAPILARSFIEKSKIKTKQSFLEESDILKKTSRINIKIKIKAF